MEKNYDERIKKEVIKRKYIVPESVVTVASLTRLCVLYVHLLTPERVCPSLVLKVVSVNQMVNYRITDLY